MTPKGKVYAILSLVCVLAAGAIVYRLIEATGKKNSNAQAQVASSQTAKAPINTAQAPASSPGNNAPAAAAGSANSNHNHSGRGGFMADIPAGDKPFFGQVASVDGSTLTVTSQTRPRPNAGATNTGTDTANGQPTVTTLTVTLAGSTAFSGGTEADLAAGTRIAGYGTSNPDGSISAVKIQIMPAGTPGGHGQWGGRNNTQSGQTN